MRMYKAFLFALVTFFLIPSAQAETPQSFSFTGAGYGHGVGMSQMGARAHALAGESATTILNYYYKDVVIAPVVDTATIRVNIGHLLRSVSFVSATPDSLIQIYAGDVVETTYTAPLATFTAKQKASFRLDASGVITGPVSGKSFTIRWIGPNSVMTFSQPGSAVKYRYGQMQMKVVKGAIEVTNSLSIHDEYLWGISEMSSAWPTAALEAQVIASRSYALSKIGVLKPSCDCHVYSHIADQNFVGYSKEIEPKIGALWKAAVIRTSIDSSTSLAILANGKPIQAYYFSASGGATQTTVDAWGQPTSYTQSVADPAGLDPKLNPRFASWKASATQQLVATAFLLPDVVSLEIISLNSAGAVTYIKGTSTNGSTKLLRGDTFRSRVKIPSPYFQLAQ
ncbi:SpoIID Sporulation protein and related proteins [Candidatus Nanopelagicaceae bacterium]